MMNSSKIKLIVIYLLFSSFPANAQYMGNPDAAEPCAFDDFQNKYSLSNNISFGYPEVIAKFGSKVECAVELRINQKCLQSFNQRASALARLNGLDIYSIPGLSESETQQYQASVLQITWMVNSGEIIEPQVYQSNNKQSTDVSAAVNKLNKISGRVCGLSKIDDAEFEKYVKPTMRKFNYDYHN